MGEEFNVKLRQQVVNVLQAQGIAAVAPMLSPHWKEETRIGMDSPQSGRSGTQRMRPGWGRSGCVMA